MIDSIVQFLRKRTSISFRIYLYSVSIFLTLLALISFVFYSYFNYVKKERIDFIDFTSTEILTSLAEKGLRRGSPELILDTFETLIAKSEISYIKIVDNQSVVFLRSGNSLSKESKIYTLSKPIYSKRTVSSQLDLDLDENSISIENRLIGTLFVYIDIDKIVSTAWSTVNKEVLLLLLFLVIFCLFIPYIISQSLVRPLHDIMGNLDKFKKGDYKFHSKYNLYIDEYAKLSEVLSSSGKSIIEAKNEIIKKNEILKEKIILLTEARNIADEANSRKNIFVKNMTHELKTPLSGATSGNDFLESYLYSILSLVDSDQDDKNKIYEIRELIFSCIKFVDISNQGIHQINSLIDNILLSIQDISENIHVQNSSENLHYFLQGLYGYYKGLSSQKGLEFIFTTDINKNTTVCCDWTRLSQILNILLSNSVKFTTNGFIKFNVFALKNINTININFEISDSGIGISDKEKISIFHLFHIAQSPESKYSSGIGVGLYTAKRLAECLGGKLSLKDSVIGLGSNFVFECEFSLSSESDSHNKNILTNKKFDNYSILYVEDSYLNQTIFKEYCNGYGIDLILAHNGKEGFEKYKLASFDIIVIDCYMPVMNGFQLIKKIRNYEFENNLTSSYIVALTADNSDQNRLRCEEYEFDLFITKPYNRHHFKQILTGLKRC